MRFLLPALLLATTLSHSAEAPRKTGGGLFGFGNPPREQISGALFPEEITPSGTTQPRSSDANTIFREGQPAKVKPISYVIENGRRVERPVQPAPSPPPAENAASTAAATIAATNEGSALEGKKRSLFGFGKKDETPSAALPPAPAPAPALTAAPVPPVAQPAPAPKPALVAETMETEPKEKRRFFDRGPAEPAAEDSKRGSWIPFVGGRKKETTPGPVVASPAATITAEPIAPATVAQTTQPAPAKPSTTASEKPGATPSFVITQPHSSPDQKPKKETKADGDSLIPNPLTKIKPPRKEIDLSGAETIIQDGQIVGESGTTFTTSAPTSPSAPRQAPQVVDGVKTYSSWDDVNARSQSAADKIINRIR